MRAETIISAFTIFLGNFYLHVNLLIMADQATAPDQDEMDEAKESVPVGDYTCVDADQLSATFETIKSIHTMIFMILVYIEIHTPFWTFINKRCRRMEICCYDQQERAKRTLSSDDVKTLATYSKQLQVRWKDLFMENEAAVDVANKDDLNKVDESLYN